MTTNAAPVRPGKARKSFSRDSRPPAEAPMPTIGNCAGSGGVEISTALAEDSVVPVIWPKPAWSVCDGTSTLLSWSGSCSRLRTLSGHRRGIPDAAMAEGQMIRSAGPWTPPTYRSRAENRCGHPRFGRWAESAVDDKFADHGRIEFRRGPKNYRRGGTTASGEEITERVTSATGVASGDVGIAEQNRMVTLEATARRAGYTGQWRMSPQQPGV
jgi:hypothetical protein